MSHMMKPEARARMEALCAQIAKEKDNVKFSELMQELIDLLDRSHQQQFSPAPSVRSAPREPSPDE
jgi:hypothetical protein